MAGMTNYPFQTPAIFVSQPFGDFIVAALPARLLLDTCYSDRLEACLQPDGSYRLDGSQRRLDDKRLKEIGGFIDKGSASFPNSIILAANYSEGDGFEVTDSKTCWSFEPTGESNLGVLTVPKNGKLAAIIDGQHRLFGFTAIGNPARMDMPLVCSIFFGLPKPYQARLFATINSTQKPVSKSQTYELFGYNLEEEAEEQWTPDKFAVFIARKLNADSESPLAGHVIVPAENDFSMTSASAKRSGSWVVSLATVVEGVVRLISSNPKKDANKMAGEERYVGLKREVLEPVDLHKAPLRELFRESNDEMIYATLVNYFKAVVLCLWKDAKPGSFIFKTVGIQALFDIAKPLIASAVGDRDVRVEHFKKKLEKASRIDFSHQQFVNASGAGRTKIRQCLEFAIGLADADDNKEAYQFYTRVLRS
ncbi:MAG: DGQHR domain-containing protein [Verrucomicrobiaceae bacterium]|nr:DGQHR domain-containing protein [Verrucomicrobiaceae bacterium]